jgi:hypothetical protein
MELQNTAHEIHFSDVIKTFDFKRHILFQALFTVWFDWYRKFTSFYYANNKWAPWIWQQNTNFCQLALALLFRKLLKFVGDRLTYRFIDTCASNTLVSSYQTPKSKKPVFQNAAMLGGNGQIDYTVTFFLYFNFIWWFSWVNKDRSISKIELALLAPLLIVDFVDMIEKWIVCLKYTSAI